MRLQVHLWATRSFHPPRPAIALSINSSPKPQKPLFSIFFPTCYPPQLTRNPSLRSISLSLQLPSFFLSSPRLPQFHASLTPVRLKLLLIVRCHDNPLPTTSLKSFYSKEAYYLFPPLNFHHNLLESALMKLCPNSTTSRPRWLAIHHLASINLAATNRPSSLSFSQYFLKYAPTRIALISYGFAFQNLACHRYNTIFLVLPDILGPSEKKTGLTFLIGFFFCF